MFTKLHFIYPVFLLVSAMSVQVDAQGWDAYLARYEAGLGSVIVNMDLQRTGPHHELMFLLITGVNYDDCTGEGLPGDKEFRRLYRISDHINGAVANATSAMLVGTFTHQCQRLDYLYVADTTGLRQKLSAVYDRKYPRYTYHIRLMEDQGWEAYHTFLFPNESVMTYMTNNRAITRMTDAGDALSRLRFIEHLIYFNTVEDRELFIRYIARMKYDVKDERVLDRDTLPFQVRLARFGTVSLDELNTQTAWLREQARRFNGAYDGWETKVIGPKQRFRLLHNPAAVSTNTAK